MEGKFSKKKYLLLKNHKGDEAEILHACFGHKPLYKLCFYSSRIRTLVAMATYIFYRLIIGTVRIDIFFCLKGYIWNSFFTELFIE